MRSDPTSGFEWSFRDVLLALAVSFMALAVLALAAAPPKPPQSSPPGRLIVTLSWEHARDIDVDLWVQGPDDAHPVGYTHRTDRTFDLLHDDRGRMVECAGEPAGCEDANTEIAVARSMPPGSWHINAVAFGSHDHVYPVRVWVTVDRIDPASHATERLFRRDGVLKQESDEITLLNFRTDAQGAVVQGSDTDTQVMLWRVGE